MCHPDDNCRKDCRNDGRNESDVETSQISSVLELERAASGIDPLKVPTISHEVS